MAGRPRGSEPRDEYLRVRMTTSGKAAAKKGAGGQSMSDYVRRLIHEDLKRRGLL
jgi:hypothetical protein